MQSNTCRTNPELVLCSVRLVVSAGMCAEQYLSALHPSASTAYCWSASTLKINIMQTQQGQPISALLIGQNLSESIDRNACNLILSTYSSKPPQQASYGCGSTSYVAPEWQVVCCNVILLMTAFQNMQRSCPLNLKTSLSNNLVQTILSGCTYGLSIWEHSKECLLSDG